jgi:hypothetical protein
MIENAGVVIRSKAFLHNKTLYVLTLVDQNSSDVDASFKKFVDSFEFIDHPAKS